MRYLAATLSAVFALAGCTSQPYVTPERLARGLVIVLPGIEGRGVLNQAICHGLDAGGVDYAIELYDWTSIWGPLANLRAEGRNRRIAEKIARRIAIYHWDYPERPVLLVGQSGGGAIAVWVTEQLPRGHDVDGIIMIAPSLSPGYMLDFPLGRTKRGIVNFHSALDWVFLGLGTAIYGTMDGYHTASAGMVGFRVPKAGGTPPVYSKLHQIAWRSKMSWDGNTGGHLSSGAAGFVAKYVAPFVLNEKWDEKLIANILNEELPDATSQPDTTSQPDAHPTWRPTTDAATRF